jgi:hypothetical protein
VKAILAFVDQSEAGNEDADLHALLLHRLGELSDKLGHLRRLKKRVDFTGYIENPKLRHMDFFWRNKGTKIR